MNTILSIEDLSYHYGGIQALNNIHVNVAEGEIVALLGGNGAGKTTTLRCVSGLLGREGQSGQVRFKGESIVNKRAERIAAAGITHVLEGRHIFSKLTVEENLRMGFFGNAGKYNDSIEYVYQLFPVLKERFNQDGGTLSGGEQQMLAVGRALMSNPTLLMMDEPSLGLAPTIVRDIFEIIAKINEDGITILLVEQNSKAALNIADRAYVVERGAIVLEDSAERLLNNEEVKKSYLGE